MRTVPWLQTDIWGDDTFCGGRVHLGVLNPQTQPLTAEDSSVRGWFDGEFYPSAVEGGNTPTVTEILQWVNKSSGVLADVDGVFSFASYDPESGEVALGNDRLGYRPLYYVDTDGWFAYAAEVKALLAVLDKLPALDEISLRQFFGFGYMLGERTWWKGIKLLPPASVLQVKAKRVKVRQYWTFGAIKRDIQAEEDVLEEFGRLWSQAVHQRSRPGTMPLLLSGGLDSRLLLAELRDQGADIAAITFGQRHSTDMRLGRRVAKIAGATHKSLELTMENWWLNREDAIWQIDGMVSGMHLHVAMAVDELRTGNCYSPQSIAGDLLFGGSYLVKNASPNWQEHPSELLSSKYLENPLYDLEEVVSVSIEDAEPYMVGPSSDCFHLHQRIRRFTTNGPGACSPYCETIFPSVSEPLLRLMLAALSDEQRVGSKFYNRFLANRYPEYFGNVPWQKNGRGLAESFPTRASRDIRRGVNRRIARVMGKKMKRYNTGFADYSNFLSASPVIKNLLSEDLLSDEILDGRARQALENPSVFRNAEFVLGLITFEIYLRKAVGIL